MKVDKKQKMRFADRLRHARRSRGITQKEFAQKLGLKQQEISRYENGNIYPNESCIKELSKELNVDPFWLAGKSYEPFEHSYTKEEEKITFGFRANASSLNEYDSDTDYEIEDIKKDIVEVVKNLSESDVSLKEMEFLKECVSILAKEMNGEAVEHDDIHEETQLSFKRWGDLLK